MIRAFVLYEGDVDPDRYAEHVVVSRKVPSGAFRHGKIFGSPMGEPQHRYYAEFEWPDMESFKAATSSDEFMAAGKDAMAMGIPFSVQFAELD